MISPSLPILGKHVHECMCMCMWGASPVAQVVKNLPAMQETRVPSLGQEDPWRRKWQPTLVFLPGESHGQRSLLGYSPWGRKRVRHDWSDLAWACVDVRWEQNPLNFKGILDQIFFSLQVEYYDLWTQIAAKSFSTSRTSRGIWRILCKTLTLYRFIIWKQSWVSWTIKKNMYKIW